MTTYDATRREYFKQYMRERRKSKPYPKMLHMPAVADVVQLYTVEKLSSMAIAERYGCHSQSIRYMLKKAGVAIRGPQEAALLSPTEWTDERVAMLRQLWLAGVKASDIRERIGISYTSRSINQKAADLGLPSRMPPRAPARTTSEISTLASAVKFAKEYRQDTIISFLPDSPQLEADWRNVLAAVRRERAAANAANAALANG